MLTLLIVGYVLACLSVCIFAVTRLEKECNQKTWEDTAAVWLLGAMFGVVAPLVGVTALAVRVVSWIINRRKGVEE